MSVEAHRIIEDTKVVSAGACTIWLQYSQVLNETLTLFISICTSVYVGRRAYRAIIDTIKDFRKWRKKREKKK